MEAILHNFNHRWSKAVGRSLPALRRDQQERLLRPGVLDDLEREVAVGLRARRILERLDLLQSKSQEQARKIREGLGTYAARLQRKLRKLVESGEPELTVLNMADATAVERPDARVDGVKEYWVGKGRRQTWYASQNTEVTTRGWVVVSSSRGKSTGADKKVIPSRSDLAAEGRERVVNGNVVNTPLVGSVIVSVSLLRDVTKESRTGGSYDKYEWDEWETLADHVTLPLDTLGYKRLYTLWRAYMKRAGSSSDHMVGIQFKYQLPPPPLPPWVWYGDENCGVLLLKKRFPSLSPRLSRIELRDDGAFGPEQALAAAKILKRNVEIHNRLKHVMYRTEKPDGSPLYTGLTRHGTPVPPVIMYDYDGHAESEVPVLPDTERTVYVDYPVRDLHRIKEEWGALSRVWPLGAGCVIVERWMDTSLLLKERHRGEAVEKRAKELGVEVFDRIGSPFGVEVAAWRAKHSLGPTRKHFAPICKASQLFPVAYSTDARPGKGVDINSAYEAALTGALSGVRDLRAMFGIPGRDGMLAVKGPDETILERTGFAVARVVPKHPYVAWLLGEKEWGVFTTLRLKCWILAGAAEVAEIRLAVVATKKDGTYDRPEGELWEAPSGRHPIGRPLAVNKAWGRQAIGRLIPGGTPEEYYISDDAEAGSIVAGLMREGRLMGYEYVCTKKKAVTETQLDKLLEELAGGDEVDDWCDERRGGFHRVSARGTEPKGCYHVHAYVLDYCAAAVDRVVFAHKWEDIVSVKTDAVVLREGVEFGGEVQIGGKIGEWKFVEAPRVCVHGESEGRLFPEGVVQELEKTAAPQWEPLLCGFAILEGPPGYGKTFECLKQLAGTQHICLTPTRKMRRALEKDAPEGRRVMTWQYALKPGKVFEPASVRIPHGAILHIGEIGTWDRVYAETIIPWLLDVRGCRIVADGDRKQMPPCVGEEPWEFLDSRARTFPWDETDHRSKTEETKALKRELRGVAGNARVFARVREETGGMVGYKDFLGAWHPHDYVYVAHLHTRDQLSKALAEIHRSKYPEVAGRVRYGEHSAKSGTEDYIELGRPIPEGAAAEYSSTYSSCQGETAGQIQGRLPKVWLVEYGCGDYFKNAAYVAATRVELREQLGVVQVPHWRELAYMDVLYS